MGEFFPNENEYDELRSHGESGTPEVDYEILPKSQTESAGQGGVRPAPETQQQQQQQQQ
jgi:hypothetical protein